ncbi:MAG: serine/threonine-protein kinase [Caldimonas sp.]
MAGLFDLDAPSWHRLRDLLDEGLTRPPPARAAWLQGLGPHDAEFVPRLKALLAHDEAGVALAESLPRVETGSFAPAVPMPDRVGPYRLIRELGRGGMGSVWLAERSDMLTGRSVALKLPHGSWRLPRLAERLEREREILATLSHPNIARLYDAGVADDGQPWLALEVVEGEGIDAWVARCAPKLPERLRLFGQVAQAVAYAHGQLVVHRDLKPANILVTADQQAKLLDFGIAKLLEGGIAEATALTREAGRAFTPEYASPEQVRGDALGTASDIYSLGVVLYELLTGLRPPRAASGLPPARPSEAARQPALRGDLDAIVLKALEPQPAARYATAQALADDIERHLHGQPVLARPANAGYLLRRFAMRHAWAAGATTAALLAVLGGAGAALWQAQLARAEARRAEAVTAFMADVLREADPYRASDSKPTVEGLIRQARDKLGNRYADQPELRVQLLTLLAVSLTGLSAFDDAQTLLQQALAEGRAALGERHPAVLRARLAMTTLYRNRLQTEPLAAAMGPLLRDLETTSGIEPGDLVGAYENAGHLAIEQRRPADAVAAADKALALLRRQQPVNDAQVVDLSLMRSVALTYMQPAQPALDAAGQTLQLALATWGDAKPHARVLDVRSVYGRALGNAGHYRQAADELARVVNDAEALLGPQAPQVAFSSADVARFELADDHPAVALKYVGSAMATLDRAGIDDAFSRLVVLSLRGQALLALRRPEATAVLEQAYGLAVQSRGAQSLTAGHVASYLALAQARAGHTDLARRTLKAHAPPSTAEGRALAFNLHHHRGVVLRLAGDSAGARAAQRQAQALLSDDDNDAWRRLEVQTELARLALADGDTAPGLALAPARAGAEPPGGPREAARLQVFGLALRAAGRADEAREPLERAAAFWQQATAGANP